MVIANGLHCLRLPFSVTPGIQSFVNVFLLTGKRIYLIDTGVADSYGRIRGYIESLGRRVEEIAAVLLTHSHPEQMGCAAKLKRASGCAVLGPAKERDWVENLETQFKARPAPDFHRLVREPGKLDATPDDKDILSLEPGMTVTVYETAGHSPGHLAFYWQEERALFTGDAVPAAGDPPEYADADKSIASLERLLKLKGVQYYLAARDVPKNREQGILGLKDALDLLKHIRSAVRLIYAANPNPETLPARVARQFGKEEMGSNPLFVRSILSHTQGKGS